MNDIHTTAEGTKLEGGYVVLVKTKSGVSYKKIEYYSTTLNSRPT